MLPVTLHMDVFQNTYLSLLNEEKGIKGRQLLFPSNLIHIFFTHNIYIHFLKGSLVRLRHSEKTGIKIRDRLLFSIRQ